jgi:mannose-6-phosphate isomerase-like protein (cupin superfamily)
MAKLPDNPAAPVVIAPGEGDVLAIGPSRVTQKLSGAATGGHFGMTEYAVEPRFVAPSVWHWHTKESWVAYVVSGSIVVACPDREITVPTGGTIVVGPNCPFVWSNPFDEPAKLLNIYTPAGFENYFREVDGVIAKNPGVAPQDLSPHLVPLWSKYGLEREG